MCLCLSFSLTYTQQPCKSDDRFDQLLVKDPAFFQKIQEYEKLKLNNSDRSSLSCNSGNSIVVPVAVHYFDPIDCSQKQCLLDAAQAQIDVMNEAFSASNQDLEYYTNTLNSVCSSSYPLSRAPTVNQGTCIQFCLATEDHPPNSGLINGEPAITLDQETWPSAGIEWSGYLNIFVSSPSAAGLSSATLGISALPGSANGDGFWVNYSVFGGPNFSCTSGAVINGHSTFDDGKTAVHEAGHYFGLFHVFKGSGCVDGDTNAPGPIDVLDTPMQDDPHYGCPNVSSCANVPSSCTGGIDNFYSYMDYSNDNCMVLFTADQSDVINYWGNYLTWKNEAITCSSVFSDVNCSGPSCYDGILNGNETGIDCGGNICNSCNYQCGEVIVDSGGASLYFPSENQSWTICANGGQVVSLSFTEFQIEDGGTTGCYDKLELFDGSDETAPSMGVFCGNNITQAPGQGYIESSSSCITLKFTSDASVQEAGWAALIQCANAASCTDGVQNGTETGIDCGGICIPCPQTCGATFYDAGGASNNYENGSFETFLFCPTTSIDKIKATFTWSDIESTSGSGHNGTGCWDMLKIYNGPDNQAVMLGNYCGEESGDGDIPGASQNNLYVGMHVTSTHTSGCLYFTFESDNSINESGWEANIECVSSIVPVTLLDFDLIRTEDKTMLSWETANEINNSGFTIQRSNDGLNFIDLDFVDAITTGTGGEYSYDDLTKGLSGKVYYRLAQVDFSEEINYSKILSVLISESQEFSSVFPNPFNDELSIEISSFRSTSEVKIYGFNNVGKRIFSKTISSSNEEKIGINTSDWIRGAYVISVHQNDKITTYKVIKI